VTVDLASTLPGNATGIAGRTTNIQMVTGGSGDDTLKGQSTKLTILIGLDGNDTLTGGLDRDLLFGELGLDTINGGGRDDVLVSGRTDFDTDRAALLRIYAEWNSKRTFAQRTANIWGNGTGDRFNGRTFLNNAADDGIADPVFAESPDILDVLTGGLGQDWFFAELSEITDLLTLGSTRDRRN